MLQACMQSQFCKVDFVQKLGRIRQLEISNIRGEIGVLTHLTTLSRKIDKIFESIENKLLQNLLDIGC